MILGRIAAQYLRGGVKTLTVDVAGDLAEMLQLPASGGLLVQEVERGSPAEAAGLRGPTRIVIVSNYRVGIGGDLLTAGDGQPIQDKESLKRLMDKKHGGDMLELTVYRNGRNEFNVY